MSPGLYVFLAPPGSPTLLATLLVVGPLTPPWLLLPSVLLWAFILAVLLVTCILHLSSPSWLLPPSSPPWCFPLPTSPKPICLLFYVQNQNPHPPSSVGLYCWNYIVGARGRAFWERDVMSELCFVSLRFGFVFCPCPKLTVGFLGIILILRYS